MKKLRIVFMGTPEFAVHILDAILDAGFEVAGVVTAPDKPAGRGRKLNESAVKKFALKKELNILQPTNLKSEDFLNELRELKANVQVVVAFRMLPKQVWEMPQLGTFNLHASLLPQYRGAAPINWAIINGEKKTGVSTFFIDEKIDTGKMIFQEPLNIEPSENAGMLHDKLMSVGARLVVKTLHAIEAGPVKTIPQQEKEPLKTAYKLNRENTRIDWNRPIEEIYNLIRGLSPYPAAWTHFINGNDEMNMKIFAAEKKITAHELQIGKIVQEKGELKIAVEGGFILLTEVQLPGKRRVHIHDLLNGYNFFPNAKVV